MEEIRDTYIPAVESAQVRWYLFTFSLKVTGRTGNMYDRVHTYLHLNVPNHGSTHTLYICRMCPKQKEVNSMHL